MFVFEEEAEFSPKSSIMRLSFEEEVEFWAIMCEKVSFRAIHVHWACWQAMSIKRNVRILTH